ncbi:MAG: hypothetical protein CYG60_25100, partial [Actinobacteria bacterium]
QGGREDKPSLKPGVCGEHGGDPKSIAFFHELGLDYVSCAPFRVPSPAWSRPRFPRQNAGERRAQAGDLAPSRPCLGYAAFARREAPEQRQSRTVKTWTRPPHDARRIEHPKDRVTDNETRAVPFPKTTGRRSQESVRRCLTRRRPYVSCSVYGNTVRNMQQEWACLRVVTRRGVFSPEAGRAPISYRGARELRPRLRGRTGV